jgi:hypothetical protein
VQTLQHVDGATMFDVARQPSPNLRSSSDVLALADDPAVMPGPALARGRDVVASDRPNLATGG